MSMALDDYIYCSPLPGVLSLDRLLSEPGEDDAPFDVRDPASMVDDRLIAEQAHDTLHQHLATLPERQRRVVEAHFLSGQTLTGIARDLGVSVAAVSKLKAKALARLLGSLAPIRADLLA